MFLSEVAVRPGISNWQVQQARDAVEVYYEQFRGISLDPRPDGPVLPASRAPAPFAPSSAASPACGTPVTAGSYADGRRGVNGQVTASGDTGASPIRVALRTDSGVPRAILPATQTRAQDGARYVRRRIVVRGGKGDKDRNRGPQGVVSPADTL